MKKIPNKDINYMSNKERRELEDKRKKNKGKQIELNEFGGEDGKTNT